MTETTGLVVDGKKEVLDPMSDMKAEAEEELALEQAGYSSMRERVSEPLDDRGKGFEAGMSYATDRYEEQLNSLFKRVEALEAVVQPKPEKFPLLIAKDTSTWDFVSKLVGANMGDYEHEVTSIRADFEGSYAVTVETMLPHPASYIRVALTTETTTKESLMPQPMDMHAAIAEEVFKSHSDKPSAELVEKAVNAVNNIANGDYGVWLNDSLQFTRLLMELDDLVTERQIEELCTSMDLDVSDIQQLFCRAVGAWQVHLKDLAGLRSTP